MQRRLRRAEDETRKLAENLAEYGFNAKQSERKQEENKIGWIEPVTPFKPTVIRSAEKELLERNYEDMVARVCRAESTIQSLKLALCSLEAERNLENGSKKPGLPSETDEEATKQLKKALTKCKKDLQKSEQARKENEEKANALARNVEALAKKDSENAMKIDELVAMREKLSKKSNDVRR